MNNSGKTSTIFIILMLLLLASSTAIGFFLYQKEIQHSKDLEIQLEESRQQQDKLQADLKDTRKQVALLEDKNKEADKKINSLMDEIELKEGLRNELKKENASLKDAMEAAKKEKDKIHSDLDEVAKKFQETQDLLKAQQEKTKGLQDKYDQLQQAKKVVDNQLTELKASMKPYSERPPQQQVASEVPPPSLPKNKMELDKIVINPQGGAKGKILSVDKDTEFVICSLGTHQGVKSGGILSVYRGDEYLGDVKVSRVQDEMCAADFVPPFSSHKVRKNDTVVLKQS